MKKLIFVLTCLFFTIPCQAKTITVNDNGSANFTTIQAAIDDANDGDIVIVQAGQYAENINFIGKNITLRSTEPTNPSVVSSTVIDGSLGGSVVTFAGTESPACVLSGFTITNGRGTGVGDNYGGGIYGNGTLATIQYNVISGNRACSPMFPSSGYGGGIYDCDGIIRYNVISENNATCNEGTASGGGLYGCDGTIQYNIIRSNSAGGFSGGRDIEGGGLSNCNGTIKNNVVSGNYAGGWWGGTRGGGLSNCDGTIQNNTIFGNRSEETRSGYPDYGGGLSGCNGTIRNCIIWQNIAYQGTQIYESSTPSFSCIEDWLGGGDGNIDLDPHFVSIGYWDLCGLPPYDSPCWVEIGDYHLRSLAGRWDPDQQTWAFDFITSPCIDAGNPGCPLGDELNDPNNIRRNMGAYGGTAEASKSPANWRSIADMTNDWVVDSNDLKVFVDYWLQTGGCIPSDFDRSQFVDFDDFAIFGLQWSYPSASELGMTYHIGDCNMEAGLRWTAAEESNEPRFKVWVEGHYIYFEDQMYANCCPDELGLDKEINGNQIILYEIGYGGLCDCMCYFPITATLGPFEDGTYTVEVYDNCGNSLGVVEVTIGGSPEPTIIYKIEDCKPDASDVFAAEPPDQTRFTVTVEGLYIHFEDMMTANCCPDELGLEMTVEDNLITIYETEYTPGGCYCICDYPVSATLGPFEPDVYVLEVYEDWGGFIGSTSIVIDPPQ